MKHRKKKIKKIEKEKEKTTGNAFVKVFIPQTFCTRTGNNKGLTMIKVRKNKNKMDDRVFLSIGRKTFFD